MTNDAAAREGLRASLSEYDGRATTILTEAAARFSSAQTYLDDLVSLLADLEPLVAEGATWLVKHHLENGETLSAGQTKVFVGGTANLTTWGAILQVCQTVRFLAVTPDDANRLAQWLSGHLDHKRPFIRAWSLDALCALARSHDLLRADAERALAKAKNDPAASVRARVRHITL